MTMNWKSAALGLGGIMIGCAAPPSPTPSRSAAVTSTPPPPVVEAPKSAPVVALLEPYLVAEAASRPIERAPVPLGGRIIPVEPSAPLTPAPPTVTRPIDPPPAATAKPAPAAPRVLPPALIRLFEDERTHAVDIATRAVAGATARVTQTTAEAKRTWDLVRAGALAQFKADQADAAARSANTEKAEAEKALSDAQERRRNARRDVEAAFSAVASTASAFSLVQATTPLPAFRPVPYTYRLSILGVGHPQVTVEGGSLGRPLASLKGEGGAWIVRCLDPSRLRVKVGATNAQVVARPLPSIKATTPHA